MNLEAGLITRIGDGHDAQFLRDYLSFFNDPEAFRFAHAAWGTDHRSLWNVIGTDIESRYGTDMVSSGRSIFQLDGRDRDFVSHWDYCSLSLDFYVDDQVIVENSTIVPENLKK